MALPSFRGIGAGTVGGGGGANLAGATPSNWSAAWGGIPQVPNPGATAGAAIGANLSNLNKILNLGSNINLWSNQQALNQVRTGLPLYDAMTLQSSNNIMDQISGRAPDDVVDMLIRRGAERGILTGTTGSMNNDAALLRALGLNSLDMMKMGEQNLTNAINRTPRGPMFDPTKMFISPDDMQSAQAASNLYASAPNPQAAGTRALGAAKAGIRRGMASGPTWSSINQGNAPSWDRVRQTPQTSADWADYGPTYAYSNPSLQGQPDAQPVSFGDWASGTGLKSVNAWDYEPDRYWADPASGGYIDMDTGDYYG